MEYKAELISEFIILVVRKAPTAGIKKKNEKIVPGKTNYDT